MFFFAYVLSNNYNNIENIYSDKMLQNNSNTGCRNKKSGKETFIQGMLNTLLVDKHTCVQKCTDSKVFFENIDFCSAL